jgi:UTP:GlnB (protein PII) uridylyltransferase
MIGFVATMPAAYERLYGAHECAEHAAIVSRRAGRPVHAELWQSSQGPVLCVVAEDRPGFLALVTDTLLMQGMAIKSARAFCRVSGQDCLEAVDFLELNELGGAVGTPARLDSEELPAFVQSLTELIGNELAQRGAPNADPLPSSEGVRTTRVYFEREPPGEGRYLLVVEAPDSDGLLHAISSALLAQGVRIMACEIRTVNGRASDRFEVEPVSRHFLRDSELCDVQLAVLDALPSRSRSR